MPNERILRVFEVLARLVGVGVGAAGLVLLPAQPILGVPLLGVGVLFALRPATAGELLDLVASLA